MRRSPKLSLRFLRRLRGEAVKKKTIRKKVERILNEGEVIRNLYLSIAAGALHDLAKLNIREGDRYYAAALADSLLLRKIEVKL